MTVPERPVVSPLTGTREISLVEEVPVEPLRDFYHRHLGVDVDRFFRDLHRLRRYRCQRTGYEFHWPPEAAGDEAFYADLAGQEWYYDQDRWEHGRALSFVSPGDRLLDVGCGSGAFLSAVRERFPTGTTRGLELNDTAVDAARAAGLDVRAERAEAHARSHRAAYDVVTSFQVLEHLTEPRPFLEALISLVRPGGRIIVGVPNNDGYLAETTNLPSFGLNRPPHHMGWWRPSSLQALTGLLPLRLEALEEEPFDSRFVGRLAYARLARLLGDGLLARAAWRLGLHRIVAWAGRSRILREKGHTVLAVFQAVEVGGSP